MYYYVLSLISSIKPALIIPPPAPSKLELLLHLVLLGEEVHDVLHFIFWFPGIEDVAVPFPPDQVLESPAVCLTLLDEGIHLQETHHKNTKQTMMTCHEQGFTMIERNGPIGGIKQVQLTSKTPSLSTTGESADGTANSMMLLHPSFFLFIEDKDPAVTGPCLSGVVMTSERNSDISFVPILSLPRDIFT